MTVNKNQVEVKTKWFHTIISKRGAIVIVAMILMALVLMFVKFQFSTKWFSCASDGEVNQLLKSEK